MPNPDIGSIREQLQLDPGSKLGFVLYRTTYADDAQWNKFMDYLNTRIRLNLEKHGDEDLFQHIDWDVQEDLALQDASEEELRNRFKTYLEEHKDSRSGSRAMACIAIPQFLLEQVLEHGPPVEKFDAWGMTCVNMISVDPEQGWHQITGQGIFGN